MFQNILIGQYIEGTSILHRFDPRSKLISVFVFVVLIFFANHWYANAAILTLLAIAIFLSRIPLRYIYRGLKPVFFLVILMVVFHLFMTREGTVIFSLGTFSFYDRGLSEGILMGIRLLTLIMFTSLMTLTTNPIDLTDGLESLFKPLEKIKLPAHELALMTSIALRFIPTLMQEAEKIMKAQQSRGVDFTSGPIKDRLKALLPLLIPLFINAFKRAEALALAMEARCYRGTEGRTKYRQLHWAWSDTVLLILTSFFALFIILSRFYV